MAKAERLLYLINLIKSNHGSNSKELAQKCEVSERTIFRDMNSLASANLPIYFDHGYRFLEGTFLPTINLTNEEFSTLQFAFEFSPIKVDHTLQELAKNILSKLVTAKNNMPAEESIIDRSIATGRCSAFGRPAILKQIKPDPFSSSNETSKFSLMFKLLQLAIDQQKAIRIKCLKRGSQLEEFLIEPYAIFSKNGDWFILCYCWHCRKIVLYDMSKIKSVSLTTQTFISKINLDKLLAIHQ